MNAARAARLAPLVLLLALLAVEASAHLLSPAYPGVWDDAYMFPRYADSVLAGHGLAWNAGGPPTYGLTSLGFLALVVPARLVLRHDTMLAAALASVAAAAGLLWTLRRLVDRVAGGSAGRSWIVAYAMLALAVAVPSLAPHVVSGMDTMFATLYAAGILLVWLRVVERPAVGSVVACGVVGGLAYVARPDLVVFALAIPGAVLVLCPELRRPTLAALGLAVAGLGLTFLVTDAVFGSALPLAFFAKTGAAREPAIAAAYAHTAGEQLWDFVVTYRLLWLPLCLAPLVPRPGADRSRAVALGAGLGAAMFAAFYLFFVRQIMGQDERFYLPLLPALVVLSARALAQLLEATGQGVGLGTVPVRAVAVVAAVAVLLPGAQTAVEDARVLATGPLVLTATDSYRLRFPDFWFRLDQLSALPDDLTIATTEVGHPAALNPHKRILDLAGLNEPALALGTRTASALVAERRPDLVYLPHWDYRGMIEELLASDVLRRDYEVFLTQPPQQPQMPVAIRIDSRYHAQMAAILRDRPLLGARAP